MMQRCPLAHGSMYVFFADRSALRALFVEYLRFGASANQRIKPPCPTINSRSYACRVFAIVYRCRREGLLSDREAIRADPARGELRVQRKGMKRIAVLLGPDEERYLLPVLDKVKLLAVNDRGILLAGIEVHPPRGSKGNGPIYPQTWWCMLQGGPMRVEASPAESRARERARQTEAIGASMARHDTRRHRSFFENGQLVHAMQPMQAVTKVLHLVRISYMNDDTQTNFGWWTDKPERPTRASSLTTRSAPLYHSRREPSVWKEAALIVALVLALGVALVRLI